MHQKADCSAALLVAHAGKPSLFTPNKKVTAMQRVGAQKGEGVSITVQGWTMTAVLQCQCYFVIFVAMLDCIKSTDQASTEVV